MGTLGGNLKRKEKITGRFADVFSWMYLASAVLRRFEAEGRRPDDRPLMQWAMEHAFAEIHRAFQGIYANLGVPVLGAWFRGPVALWGRLNPIGTGPNDRLGSQVARVLQQPGATRDRLTDGIFVPDDPREHLATLENALTLHWRAEDVVRKIKDAIKLGNLPRARPETLVEKAVAQQVLTKVEGELLASAEAARHAAIAVDSFSLEEYLGGSTAHAREESISTI